MTNLTIVNAIVLVRSDNSLTLYNPPLAGLKNRNKVKDVTHRIMNHRCLCLEPYSEDNEQFVRVPLGNHVRLTNISV